MTTPRIRESFSATGGLVLTENHVFYGAKSILGTRGGRAVFLRPPEALKI